MKSDISIIVPIYNSEKYLNKCLNSLINQTKKELEFILINDGSTDNTDAIIRSFNDKRIKYFSNKNQGIGKTRNFGIDKATGKYIMFIDSDDYIDLDCCKLLFEKIEEEKSDIVVSDFYKDIEGKIEYFKIDSFKSTSLKENPSLLLSINLGPCNKLFKRKIIIDNKIKFNEEYKYEDMPFICEYLLKANKISKLNKALSYYCIHDNSETTIRDERIFDILKIIKIVRRNLGQYNYLKGDLDKLTVRIITNYTVQQRDQRDTKVGDKFIEEAFSYLKKEVPNYKDNKYYPGRGIFKRTIEKNKALTKLYCIIYKFFK